MDITTTTSAGNTSAGNKYSADEYSVGELEELFQLPLSYTVADIFGKKDAFLESMRANGFSDDELMGNYRFLDEATKRLVLAKTSVLPPAAVVPDFRALDERPARPYTLTSESDVLLSGKMNPLSTRLITKCLTVDTRFREDYFSSSSSDLYIQLPQKLSRVVSMQLSALELPMTFYGIMQAYGNNFLYLTATYYVDGDGVMTTTITPATETATDTFSLTIPDGNYNAQDLITTINNLLAPTESDGVTLLYPDSAFSYIQFTLDVTTSGSGTAKVYVQNTGAKADAVASFRMDFTADVEGQSRDVDLSSTLAWNLGFRKRLYDGNTFYASETTIEPTTIRYVYLVVDDFNHSVNQHFMTAYQSQSQLNANILARIALRGAYFTMIMENTLNLVTEPRKYFGPVDITKLHIQLIDDRGRVVPMNSADYAFCLTFKMLYDP